MTNRVLVTFLLITLFASCSSSARLSDDTAGQRLIFGSGGGFTGVYTRYELNEDGRVFSLQPDGTKQQLKKLRKKPARDIFERANMLKAALPGFEHPGNMTWFIQYQSESKTTEYKWGDTGISVPIELQELYNQLTEIIK